MKEKDDWKALCSKAAKEQDPTKLRRLVVEINKLICEEQARRESNAAD
jgi:hypothetical protein